MEIDDEEVATAEDIELALSAISELSDFEKGVVINRYLEQNDPNYKRPQK